MKFPPDITQAPAIPRSDDCGVKGKTWERIRNPLSSPSAHIAMTRAYLRDLRAAEMAAWEMTGGDYLISEAARIRIKSSFTRGRNP